MERLTINAKQLLQAIKLHVICGAPIEVLNYRQDYVGIRYSKANGYYMLAGDIYVTYEGCSTGKSIRDFRFLLRPLSQLTEEIDHNGKRFVPMVELEKIRKGVDIYQPLNLDYPIEITIQTEDYSQEVDLHDGYLIMQKLLEWHFDVFGLIDHDLALPIDGKEVEE